MDSENLVVKADPIEMDWLTEVFPYYQITPGWLHAVEAFALYAVARSNVPAVRGVIVEIGSFQGKSTICLAKALADKDCGSVIAIDPFNGAGLNDSPSSDLARQMGQNAPDKLFTEFLVNLKRAGVGAVVKPIRGYAQDYSAAWEVPIDMLFIDADHRYEAVKRDVLEWTPKIKPNGILAMHDVYFEGDPPADSWEDGPGQVVNELILHSNEYHQFSRTGSLFICRKNEDDRSPQEKHDDGE